MASTIRILTIGDVIGKTGRTIFQKHIHRLRKDLNIDVVIVNGENSTNGIGINNKSIEFFKENGVDVVTSGNHIWANRDIFGYFEREKGYVLRPANYPSACPGEGHTILEIEEGLSIGVMNLQGRVFIREHTDCPFRTADSILTFLKSRTNIVVIDFHAETTSEKYALAYYLDGQVSAVVGTHTHVPTADERILPGGTAFVCDLGMVGSLNSMIGMKKGPILRHFLTQMPMKFEIETDPPFVLSGAWFDVDVKTGKATKIERVYIVDK